MLSVTLFFLWVAAAEPANLAGLEVTAIGKAGLLVFALALALLAIGGGRELLRLRAGGLAILAVLGALALLAEGPAAPVFGLLCLASFSLVHAGGAMRARTAPGPRERALIWSLVVLGFAGAVTAIVGQLGLSRAVDLASAVLR